MIESGYKCTNSQTVASYTWTPICGDGYRVGSEQCDDNTHIRKLYILFIIRIISFKGKIDIEIII